jgi:uncharacterized protein (UPF0332 family)
MFDALRLLAVANDLGDPPTAAEEHFRSAINRAYFATHLKAGWGLERAGLFTPKGSGEDHGGVIATLRSKMRRPAAERLNELRSLRDTADYDLRVQVTAERWGEASYLAAEVVRLLEADWQ